MTVPPFYANTPDNTHCFQACLKMVLEHFTPTKTYSFDELDVMTAKIKDLWTWPMAGIINLYELGYQIKILDPWGKEGYEKFAKLGEQALLEDFGPEIASEQIKNSYIEQEKAFAKELISFSDITIDNEPSIEKIKGLLNEGFLVVPNVNQNKLNDEKGYTGHFLVVYQIDDKHIHFHDPGLPSQESRKLTIGKFEEAWSATNDAYAFKF